MWRACVRDRLALSRAGDGALSLGPPSFVRARRSRRSAPRAGRETFDTLHLEPHQRVNHYRNSRELCRKDLLIKNLKRQKRQLQREGNADEAAAYDFWPMTYMLPGDYALFAEEFKRTGGSGGGARIMKPIGRSQGKGIFIFKTLSAISKVRR
jgi:tubulin polyglutamylase TTLL9